MNWRKHLIYFLFYASGSKIPQNLRKIRKWESATPEQLEQLTRHKLSRLLLHSYNNVPYYRKILVQSQVIIDDRVRLENLSNIPPLTKEIIRNQANNLYSKDYKKRKPYENTSGGSTGEPVRFIQDKYYQNWNIANKIYYKTFAGQQIGDKEFRLWGSERDLLEGRDKLSVIITNWLYNRTNLNAFKMTEKDMRRFVDAINREAPKWIEAYVQPMYEFAQYIKKNNLRIHSPNGVLTSAGTLYPEIKDLIEEVFRCKTFNRYGSREVGDIACNCDKQQGLHISVWNIHLEILDDKLTPVEPGQTGRIYVTTLNNYSMPLIRYDIGDMAVAAQNQQCPCHRATPVIAKVAGRVVNLFKNKDGSLIDGEYFTHLCYFKDWIRKFQVVQKTYDYIKIYIVLNGQPDDTEMKNIERDIKVVMGRDCRVDFEFVDQIPPTKSGKYLYTISEVV